MKHSIYLATVVAIAALALAGCGTSASPDGDAEERGGNTSTGEETNEPTATETELVGTWEVDQRFDNDEQPFVAFADDGTWIGTDGCNAVNGTFELADDGSWTATSGPQTMMACEGTILPTLVATAMSAKLDGKKLEFTSDTGEITTLNKVSDAIRTPLSRFPQGHWGEAGDSQPYLIFTEDLKVTGFDGCNQVRGEWAMGEGGFISLDAPASTRKICSEVDTWLSTAASAHVESGSLVLQNGEGVEIGRLARGGLS